MKNAIAEDVKQVKPADETLTPEDVRLLDQCEKTILGKQQGFYFIGKALKTILVKKLFRQEAHSFDKFVQMKLGIRYDYAKKQIAAMTVSDEVDGIFDDREGIKADFSMRIIQNEAQARELLKVNLKEQRKVAILAFEEAKKAGHRFCVTDIQNVIAERLNKMDAKKPYDIKQDMKILRTRWKTFFLLFADVYKKEGAREAIKSWINGPNLDDIKHSQGIYFEQISDFYHYTRTLYDERKAEADAAVKASHEAREKEKAEREARAKDEKAVTGKLVSSVPVSTKEDAVETKKVLKPGESATEEEFLNNLRASNALGKASKDFIKLKKVFESVAGSKQTQNVLN